MQTEEALEAANELLEQRVDERTAELQRLNAELARAKTVAEEANLSKTRFLAAASHDILQPLNAARLYASSLTEAASQAGSAERADLARNVDLSLEAVEEILGALLDISRLDAGATRPEVSDVPIADLMRMLEIEFAPIARSKGLELRFVPTTLAIRTDRRLMRRLLQNLVSNALKYTLKGRVLVGCRRIRRRRCGSKSGTPGSAFRRTGSGRCSTSSSGSTRARGSRAASGSACRSSSAWAACSAIRWGSIRGPAKARCSSSLRRSGKRATRLAAEDGAPPVALAGEPLNGLKVLAIDNEPRVLEGMRALLSRWGCAVATAHGLAEAREACELGPPDVVIADYHLDEGDGIEAIRPCAATSAGSFRRSSRPPTAAPRCATARPARTSSSSTSR